MRTELCDRFGIDYPIFVFTPSEKVAAAVSSAGGLGVLGCVRFNDADDLERVLQWMDENTDGKPYGVDIVMPAKVPTEGTAVDIDKLIPQTHRDFVDKTLADLGVPPLPEDEARVRRRSGLAAFGRPLARRGGAQASDQADRQRARVRRRKDVIDQVHAAGVPWRPWRAAPSTRSATSTTASTSSSPRATRPAGTPVRSARWCWCRKSSTLLMGKAAVLAAGGIGTGRQVAAALALGAQGVWMGSAFLTAAEYDLGDRLPCGPFGDPGGDARARTSSDTVRRRIYTGKPARLLKSRWTDAWDADGAPEPLPMPLQNILVSEAHQRMSESADPTAVAMPVGQIVGRMNEIRPVADIIAELVTGFEDATRRLDDIRG